jgi:hypothetical protein
MRSPAASSDPDWRAKTLASFEGGLSEHHRALLSPLVQTAEAASKATNPHLWQEQLVELALGRYPWVTPWLRACALRVLDASVPSARTALMAAAGESDPLVAEIAAIALDASGSNGQTPKQERLAHLSTIDKVMVLKNVSIFEAIPHEVLASIALLLTERRLAAGERVFDKGELGDSLYVIADGRVRVHDGDRTLREMSQNDFFGELALLDSEPRSASVTAIEPTLILRLAQDDFYALMSEQPVITRAINRALCKLIRSA